MSLPYMPLYVTDYEGDTAHLSLEEDGIYNRLLRLCWRTPGCSIPDDPAWIARHMRIDAASFEAKVRPILDEFFTRDKARLCNPRLVKEFERITTTSKKRSEAGKLGGRPAKALKANDEAAKPGISKAQAKQNHPDPESESRFRGADDESISRKKPATALPADWRPSPDFIAVAVDKHLSERSARIEAEKFKNHALERDRRCVDWKAAWRNWVIKAIEFNPDLDEKRRDYVRGWSRM